MAQQNGDQPKGQRVWVIEPPVIETGDGPMQENELDVDYLAGKLAEMAPVLCRIGGSVHIGASRLEVAPGIFVTEKAVVRWNSFMPARRQPAQPAQSNGASEEEIPRDDEFEVDDSAAAQPVPQE